MSLTEFFDTTLLVLLTGLVALRLWMWNKNRVRSADGPSAKKNEVGLQSLHYRYLAVFWILRAADWMQGPYFYEVYASKRDETGEPFSQMTIAILFLCGFISSGICGTFVGVVVDKFGRKKGCLALCVIYSLSALTTTSNSLTVLVLGRFMGGVATSLLESAPESWFVCQHNVHKIDGSLLGKCFGWAWFGNSIVAIIAGYLASTVATVGSSGEQDPTAPFMASVALLVIGFVMIAFLWGENYGSTGSTGGGGSANAKALSTSEQISSTLRTIRSTPSIALVGAIQSLFEGSMYVFVLAWAPCIKAFATGDEEVPFGKIFSCFMVCCMVGSSLFGELMGAYGGKVEKFIPLVLVAAAGAMSMSAILSSSFLVVVAGFFVFEATVGMYFPSINCLRSAYVPNEIRSTAMNIFRVPLNVIVVTLNLSVNVIGTNGSLFATGFILVAAFFAATSLKKMYVTYLRSFVFYARFHMHSLNFY